MVSLSLPALRMALWPGRQVWIMQLSEEPDRSSCYGATHHLRRNHTIFDVEAVGACEGSASRSALSEGLLVAILSTLPFGDNDGDYEHDGKQNNRRDPRRNHRFSSLSKIIPQKIRVAANSSIKAIQTQSTCRAMLFSRGYKTAINMPASLKTSKLSRKRLLAMVSPSYSMSHSKITSLNRGLGTRGRGGGWA
jgi:hypothetical protein